MIKKEIPPSSNWYTQKYKHRRWFRTDESEIQLAYSTGSTIKPEIVHDYLWIESKLILLIEKCINNKLQEKRFSEVAQLVNHIGKYLRIVSYEGDVSSAVNILDNISYRIINYMTVNNVSSYEYEYLALIDLFASMPINIFLAYLSKVDSFDTNKMRKTINCIKWTNDYDIYRHNISKYQHDKLDWIRKRIESEIMTDNKIISPVWYITELLLNKEADKLFINTNDLITGNINLFNKWHQSLIVLNNPWYTSQLIDREWEYTNKVKIHLDTFISKMENIARQRNIEELKWPEYKKEDYERIIDEFNSQVISGMAEHIVPLVINKRSEEYPDTSGEYLHVTCEYIFNIILNNDVKLLDKCFKSYLFGCLLLFDEMRPKGSLEDWNAQQQMKIASAILVDVMCLSGYAKLMSEYYENESMWNIILKYWDIYLGQNDGIARYKGLIAIIALKQTSYEIPYRSVLRTSWMLQIKEKLRKLPRKNISNRMFMENLDDIAHNSSLIKLLTPGPFGLLYDGIDIFLGYYLRSHRFKKEASFDWIKRDLMKDINSIENRNQDI